MNRADVGFAAMHGLLALPGYVLLYGLGLIGRVRDLPGALGPAYLAGVATVMPVLIGLLVLGLPARMPQFLALVLVVTALLAAAALLLQRRGLRSEIERPPPGPRGETWGWRAGVAGIALFFVAGASAFTKLPTGGDEATIWTYKALGFFHFGGKVDVELFQGKVPGPAHADYPVLQPLLESLFFRAMGGSNTQLWHLALWVLFGAFVWTVGWLLRTRGAPALVLLAPLAAVAVAPAAIEYATSGYADLTVACFAGLGALGIGLWIDTDRRRYAVLGALFLTAAANTKNEGQLAAAAVMAAAAIVVVASRWRGWRTWLASAGVIAAGTLPWIVWRGSHGLKSHDTNPLSEALSIDFLSKRTDRLDVGFEAVVTELGRQGHWAGPTFLVIAITCLIAGAVRRTAGFYFGAALLMFAGLVWVYWTGRLDVNYWVADSADRTIAGVVLIAAVGAAHLAARTFGGPQPPPDPPARPG